MSINRVYVQYTQTFDGFTRPSNTTTYTAGDVIADSASAATILKFSRCAGEPGQGGFIKSAILIDSSDESTKLNADLFLFNVSPVTYGNDNEAFAPTDAELRDCVGVITLDGTVAANLKAGSGNSVINNFGIDMAFTCTINERALYGVLVARNAYVPTSAEVFRIKLGVLQS